MLDGVSSQRHSPAALLPKKNRYLLYRRLGGPQGRSGQVRKILLPPGFDPRTIQPVTSRYTDCAVAVQLSFLHHVQVSFQLVIYYTVFFFVFRRVRKIAKSDY